MLVLTTSGEGLEEARGVIDALGLAAADTLPVRKDIGEQFLGTISQRFATGTAPDGSKWPESGRAKFAGGQTDFDHAVLRDSFYYDPDGEDLVFASNDIRAGVLTEGQTEDGRTSITPKKGEWLIFTTADGRVVHTKEVHLVPRRVLDFNDEDIEMVTQKIISYFGDRF